MCLNFASELIKLSALMAVLFFVFPCNAYSAWPSPPAIDVSASFPQFPSNWTKKSQLEEYRIKLDDYLSDPVETFNKKLEAYRQQVDRERKRVEGQYQSGKMSAEDYQNRMDEYRDIFVTVYPQGVDAYRRGVAKYRSALTIYQTESKKPEPWGWI